MANGMVTIRGIERQGIRTAAELLGSHLERLTHALGHPYGVKVLEQTHKYLLEQLAAFARPRRVTAAKLAQGARAARRKAVSDAQA